MIKLTVKIADREITIEVEQSILKEYFTPSYINELIKQTVEQALKLNS